VLYGGQHPDDPVANVGVVAENFWMCLAFGPASRTDQSLQSGCY